VMEYIHGRSLKNVIQEESPMPVERVCAIVKQVASALDAAHGLGIVHRDIKPGNIVLLDNGAGTATGDGVTEEVSLESAHRAMAQSLGLSQPYSPDYPLAKVLDFGIARIKEGRLENGQMQQLTLTGSGMVVGTPAYMSPEQASGKRGSEIDGRSDLYSLGVVMYQMLAGELPLKADSEMALMIAHIQTAPADIRTRRADLPEPLARLVMRCLEKNPDDRPASGKALIEEIESWEQESARLQAARRRAEEEEARQKAEEARRVEAERQAREEAEAREVEQRARDAEEARAREMAEAERRAQEAEAWRRAQAQRKAQEEAEALQRSETARRAREAEETAARARAEAEQRARAEEARRLAEAERRARTEEAQRESQAALRALRESAPGKKEEAAETAGEALEAHAEPAGRKLAGRSKLAGAAMGIAAVIVVGVALSVYLVRLHRAAPVIAENAGAASTSANQAVQAPQTPAATQPEPITPAAPQGAEQTQPETPPPTQPPSAQIDELLRQGDTYSKNAEYDAAIKQYQRAADLDPTNSEAPTKIERARRQKRLVALVDRGDSYYQNGDYDSAIGQYQKALTLDPNNPELAVKIKKAQTAKGTEKGLSIR
jgi:hypothetical protein